MKLKLLSAAIVSTLTLSGCSVFSSDPEQPQCYSSTGEMVNCNDIALAPNSGDVVANDITSPISNSDPSLFKSNINFVLLSEYVEQMAMDLKNNLNRNSIGPVAVTSFVTLDASLKNSTLLGNQISEYFVNELKQVDIPVSDFKVTGYIQVTPTGDFAMSREFIELRSDLHIDYVLTGTLVKHERGMIVNSRIVSLNTNQVVASASKLVPNIVLDNT